MKSRILALIASNKGRMIAMLAAFITGGVMQAITSLGLQLEADDAVLVSGMAALAAGWIIESIAAKINGSAIATIQDALPGIQPTGHADTKTVEAVQQLAENAQPTSPEKSGRPLSIEEAQQIKTNLHEIARRNPAVAAELRSMLATITPPPPTP